MNKQQKEVVVSSLKENFSQNEASFLVNVKGLTVEQSESLRKKLREKGGRLQIVKVRLMKRALNEVEGVRVLEPYMKEQIGVVFAPQGVPAVAKVLSDFSKDNEKFKIIVAAMEASLLTAHEVRSLASLPPRPVLLGQVIQAMQAPLVGLVFMTNQMMAQLVTIIEQVEKKKQEQEEVNS